MIKMRLFSATIALIVTICSANGKDIGTEDNWNEVVESQTHTALLQNDAEAKAFIESAAANGKLDDEKAKLFATVSSNGKLNDDWEEAVSKEDLAQAGYRTLDNGKKPGLGKGAWCKSGQEHYGTCVECKANGHCPSGKYCEHQRCYNKKGVGAHVGWTAHWKCHSNMEWHGKCAECKNHGQCPSGKYCEWGRCHNKKGIGGNVGWTAGWKCHSGMESNGV